MLELAFDARRPANSGRVDQQHVAAVRSEPHVDRIARRAGSVIDDRAFESREAISSDDLPTLGRPISASLKSGDAAAAPSRSRQARDDLIEQFVDSASVRRRDEKQFVAAERVELRRFGLLPRPIDLVDRHDERASSFAHQRERFGVGLAQPAPAVEHENYHVGDADRGERLADDPLSHPLMAAKLEPAAVDHDELAVAVFRAREIQIARGAGNRAGNRAPALR